MSTEEGEHRNLSAPVTVDGHSLTLEDVEEVARRGRSAGLTVDAHAIIASSQRAVQRFVQSGQAVYGVNTGFGSLSTQAIPAEATHQLQLNLLRSHASGAGDLLPDEVVRAGLLLRANSLTVGYSGVRIEVIETLLALLNAGIQPLIPSQGSLGASGDLAPLAHMSLALVGIGNVVADGEVVAASQALKTTGIHPLDLGPKEALALTNGTTMIAATASLALIDAERLCSTAIAVAALTMTALGARREPFDQRLQEVRPHQGQIAVARQLRALLGELEPGSRHTTRIQDPYSIRCVPQVYGAVHDALGPLRNSLEIELNAATDNPLIFADDDESISGGNFHGHPLALPIEYAKTAIASLGTIIERRIALLVDTEEYGLPAFLVKNPGINSGYMIAHYLAAGLVAENRVLAHPAAVDSIPTSANIEDYNSMGMTAARHLRQILENVEKIVAVEALCAAQACDLNDNIPVGPLGQVYETIRAQIPMLEQDDRVIAEDVETARLLVKSGALNTGIK